VKKSFKRPVLPGSNGIRRRARVRFLFAFIVLVSVPLVMVALFRTEAVVRFNGVVDPVAESIGPLEPARIAEVLVTEGQSVKTGDMLVRLASTKSILEDAMNDLRIRELEQRVATRRDDIRESERRAFENVRVAEIELAKARMERVQGESELKATEAEIARLEPLVSKRLISEIELVKLRPAAGTLRGVLPQHAKLVAAHEQALAAAKESLDAVRKQREESEREIDASIAAIREAQARNDAIRKANPLVLRAPADGTVTKIFRRGGAIVVEGEPVLRMKFSAANRYVTGMLTSGQQDAVKAGDEVFVTRRIVSAAGTYPSSVRAVVESVDAEVLDLFDDSGRAENTTVRGRKARIRLTDTEEALSFVPGESVIVSDRPLSGFSSLFGAK